MHSIVHQNFIPSSFYQELWVSNSKISVAKLNFWEIVYSAVIEIEWKFKIIQKVKVIYVYKRLNKFYGKRSDVLRINDFIFLE